MFAIPVFSRFTKPQKEAYYGSLMAQQISQTLNAVSECWDHPFSENQCCWTSGPKVIIQANIKQSLHLKSIKFYCVVVLNLKNLISGQPTIGDYDIKDLASNGGSEKIT